MSQQGKSTSGSHKSPGRAPRPLFSALPLPEIAQGLEGGEDPSRAPSMHLHSDGETEGSRRDLQRSNGADEGGTQPWLFHPFWVLQPPKPKAEIRAKTTLAKKTDSCWSLQSNYGLTPHKLGPPRG